MVIFHSYVKLPEGKSHVEVPSSHYSPILTIDGLYQWYITIDQPLNPMKQQ